MALTVDSAQFLIDQVVKDLNSVQDVIIALGVFYGVKLTFKLVFDTSKGVWTFIVPRLLRLCRRSSLKDQYGPWAVVTNATQGFGPEFVTSLVRRGFKVLIITVKDDGNDSQFFLRPNGDIEVMEVKPDASGPDSKHIRMIEERLNEIDYGILVNIPHEPSVQQIHLNLMESAEEVRQQFQKTYLATRVTNLALYNMISRNSGLIVNVGPSVFGTELVSSGFGAFWKQFSKALMAKTRANRIYVQTLSPLFSSKRSRAIPVLIPSCEHFVDSVISTWTFSNETSGYWLHDLFLWTSGPLLNAMKCQI